MRRRRLAAVGICGTICFFAAQVAITNSAASDRRHDAIYSRIPHQPIESSAIMAIGYSKRLRALEIEFKRGGTYRYLDVPPSVHRALLAAESKARFYNRHVRGKYRSIRVGIVRGR
jgi:hypothetical protein